MDLLDIAKVCHEVNRAYCKALGDDSQKPWADAPLWQRSSALDGVEAHIADPDLPPSASHELWLKEKMEAGWRYGLVKDEERKEHPCIVPFDRLPKEQQAKDSIFAAVVRELRPYFVKSVS